jgi:hypothetical protein
MKQLLEAESVWDQLLKSENPAIRYRVLTELIGISETNPKILNLKLEIELMPDVVKVFKSMHPDGYWLQKNPRTGRIAGDGVEYGAFATTHFILSYLSELGLTNEHPLISKAAERYLNLISPDGDWWNHMSCLTGLNIRTFIKLGYRNDERLQRAIDLMLNTHRFDNGYLCDMHEMRSKRKKSCYRGALKMLLAFSELPEYYNHPRVQQLIEYFLNRDVIFNSNKSAYVNSDINRFSYPIIWRANTWETLYALSKMGCGNHPKLQKAWQLIENKRDISELILLDWTPVQCPIKFGKRNNPNEWITLNVELAKKFRKERSLITQQ